MANLLCEAQTQPDVPRATADTTSQTPLERAEKDLNIAYMNLRIAKENIRTAKQHLSGTNDFQTLI